MYAWGVCGMVYVYVLWCVYVCMCDVCMMCGVCVYMCGLCVCMCGVRYACMCVVCGIVFGVSTYVVWYVVYMYV